MSNQFIITIGREYGSGGRVIAYALAEKYGINVYDSNMIEIISKEKNVDFSKLKKFDEKARNVFFSRSVDGFSNSPEDNIAQMQFDFIKEKADSGESFVVLGRCGNYVLKDNPNLISVFVTGDMEQKVNRIAEIENVDKSQAESLVIKNNKKRKTYHNYYCKEKWGDSRCYDLIINTSKIGIDNAARVISEYIDIKINK